MHRTANVEFTCDLLKKAEPRKTPAIDEEERGREREKRETKREMPQQHFSSERSRHLSPSGCLYLSEQVELTGLGNRAFGEALHPHAHKMYFSEWSTRTEYAGMLICRQHQGQGSVQHLGLWKGCGYGLHSLSDSS